MQNGWLVLPNIFQPTRKAWLETQLNHFVIDASSSEELKNITTIAELCRCLVDTGRHVTHNLIDRLLRLLLTLPVSIASAERVFSILKIIKTRLRNKMEDEFSANSTHRRWNYKRLRRHNFWFSRFKEKESGLLTNDSSIYMLHVFWGVYIYVMVFMDKIDHTVNCILFSVAWLYK